MEIPVPDSIPLSSPQNYTRWINRSENKVVFRDRGSSDLWVPQIYKFRFVFTSCSWERSRRYVHNESGSSFESLHD